MLLESDIRVQGRHEVTLVWPRLLMKVLAALRNVSILMRLSCIRLMTLCVLVCFPHIPYATSCVQLLLAPMALLDVVVIVVCGSPEGRQKNGHR